MAEMMQQQMTAPGTAARPPVEDPSGGGMQEATPEEQEAYEAYVSAGMEIIYPEEGGVNPVLLKLLQAEYDDQTQQRFAQAEPPLRDHPVDALAVAAVTVVLQIEDIAAQNDGELADEIVYNGGAELLGQLADISSEANFHDYPEKDVEGAWYRALDLYRISSSRVDPEALKQGFGTLVEANQQGQLGKVLPGIEQAAARTGEA